MTGPRRWGYRLFGRAFDYVLHLRPAEWPIMAGHTALGSLLALTAGGGSLQHGPGTTLAPVVAGLAAWVVCLNGGTLAINSAVDQDEGDVAYLRSPPPPPKGLFAFGLALMAVGQAIALTLSRGYAMAYAICFILSVLYSVPPFRLKAVAGADWLINMWGFGTLTPYAGWAATGRPLTAGAGLLLLGFCPLFAALYPLTQLYQMEEDRRRGDRTLALRLGLTRSLAVAIACALVAFGLFAAAGRRAGWPPPPGWRWVALGGALAAWLAVLVPWFIRREKFAPAQHQRGMYLALGAWAATDVVAWLAFSG